MNDLQVISFDTTHQSLLIPRGSHLSETLTIENSPILFGCRTGICGTCLVEILHVEGGQIPEPSEEEAEVLSLLTNLRAGVRLACQLQASANISLRVVDC